jgi:hypothetical protein
MSDLSERLKRDMAALERLERKRSENRMSPADCDEEYAILASSLSDLEEDILSNPGALDPQLVRVRRNKPSR